jgi:hypothetical protein
MDSSHISAAAITAMLAIILVWATTWPLAALDLPTASALAGLLVAAAGGAVKLYQSYRPPPRPALVVTGRGGLAREP